MIGLVQCKSFADSIDFDSTGVNGMVGYDETTFELNATDSIAAGVRKAIDAAGNY